MYNAWSNTFWQHRSQKMVPTCALPEIDVWRLKDCLPFGKGQVVTVVNVFFLHMYILGVQDVVYVCFFWKGLGCQQSQKHLYAFFKGEKTISTDVSHLFWWCCQSLYQTNNINNLVFLIAPSQKVIGSCTYMMTSSLYFCWVNRDPVFASPWQDASSPGAVSKAQQKSGGSFQCPMGYMGTVHIYLQNQRNVPRNYKVRLSQVVVNARWFGIRIVVLRVTPKKTIRFDKMPGSKILFHQQHIQGSFNLVELLWHTASPQKVRKGNRINPLISGKYRR